MSSDIHMLTPNKLVNLYLMSSYLYYIKSISPMTDSQYDEVCRCLLEGYSNIVNHQHSGLIDKDSLRAGTAYHIREIDYPMMVKSAAFSWKDAGFPICCRRRSRRRPVEEPKPFTRRRRR